MFECFVDHSPISVMVWGTLERVLGADPLDLWYECMAHKPYTRDLLFSTVYDLMSQVVLRIQPSVDAAYRAQEALAWRCTASHTAHRDGMPSPVEALHHRLPVRSFQHPLQCS